jgi:hypothetical protein
MAKIVLHADSYPVGTDLRDLFPSSATAPILVTEIGATGRYYWRYATGANSLAFPAIGEEAPQYDLLLLSDMTATEVGASNIQRRMGLRFPGWSGFNINSVYEYGILFTDASTTSIIHNNTDTITTDTNPTPIPDTYAAALRFSFTGGDTVKMKAWGSVLGGLEAAEPASYVYEATTPNAIMDRAPAPTFLSASSFDRPVAYTTISLGTDGDLAPYPDPTQVVTAPTGLTVSNITATSADVDWT